MHKTKKPLNRLSILIDKMQANGQLFLWYTSLDSSARMAKYSSPSSSMINLVVS
ncbi:hypothetical protein C2845_PM15G07410 [Panicum miliaceum]|uniref:Uncharacterized protein n=1 Tax=Panicum miliaceum TaxID=4540 RepID=A0A3L6Q952_PANMI|nr:hypothetical protein C2845_PM15G07410 [Panicum miliaceum]